VKGVGWLFLRAVPSPRKPLQNGGECFVQDPCRSGVARAGAGPRPNRMSLRHALCPALGSRRCSSRYRAPHLRPSVAP